MPFDILLFTSSVRCLLFLHPIEQNDISPFVGIKSVPHLTHCFISTFLINIGRTPF
jgi:hypothetical protein